MMDMNEGAKALEASGKFSISDDLRRVMAEYPDLDIYAPPGTKVRAVYLDGKPYHGGKYDHEVVVKHLKQGEVYTIANMDVGGWSTSVELVEFPDVWFNSVCLSPVL